MPHDENGSFGAVPLNPRDKIGSTRVQREKFRLDTLPGKHIPDILGNARFVAWRIGRIDPDQFAKVNERLLSDGHPVHEEALLRMGFTPGTRAENEQQAQADDGEREPSTRKQQTDLSHLANSSIRWRRKDSAVSGCRSP